MHSELFGLPVSEQFVHMANSVAPQKKINNFLLKLTSRLIERNLWRESQLYLRRRDSSSCRPVVLKKMAGLNLAAK